eukprot:SAG31_NODE_285_length_18479_cov_9.871980_11_plen_84_part_00
MTVSFRQHIKEASIAPLIVFERAVRVTLKLFDPPKPQRPVGVPKEAKSILTILEPYTKYAKYKVAMLRAWHTIIKKMPMIEMQ